MSGIVKEDIDFDEDEKLEETPSSVVSVLGFDPLEIEDESDLSELEN
jgi:hypothetical protein